MVFSGNELSVVEISSNVTSAGEFSFSGNKIVDFKIPDTIQIIEESSFSFNPIKTVTFGTDLSSMGVGALSNNPNAFINYLYSSIYSLQESMSNYLTELIIPTNVVNIGDYAFYSMSAGTK